MSNELALPQSPLRELADAAAAYVKQARSDATRRAYAGDWARFEAWCVGASLRPMPAAPETVALYVTHLAQGGHKASTIQRALHTISTAHQTQNQASPTVTMIVRETMRGIRRQLGVGQRSKSALVWAEVQRLVDVAPDSLAGRRDIAMVLVGFAGGLRRSELVGLDVEDVESNARGTLLHLRRSKTDQEGKGQQVAIPYGRAPYCPTLALQQWVSQAGLTAGPLFRAIDRWGHISSRRMSGAAVALVVKRLCPSVGLDPALFAAHSLRSGFITSAYRAGVKEEARMRHVRHKSVETHRRYVQHEGLFDDNPADAVFSKPPGEGR